MRQVPPSWTGGIDQAELLLLAQCQARNQGKVLKLVKSIFCTVVARKRIGAPYSLDDALLNCDGRELEGGGGGEGK